VSSESFVNDLVELAEEAKHEIDNAHLTLDIHEVPRRLDPDSDVEMTLAARIAYALGDRP
jgi:hypothetical protein